MAVSAVVAVDNSARPCVREWLASVHLRASGSPSGGSSVACGAGEARTERAQVSGEFWRLVHLELAAGKDQPEGQPFQRVGMRFEPAGPLAGHGEITCGTAQSAGHLCGRSVQGGDGPVSGAEGVELAGDVGGSVGRQWAWRVRAPVGCRSRIRSMR